LLLILLAQAKKRSSEFRQKTIHKCKTSGSAGRVAAMHEKAGKRTMSERECLEIN